MTLTFMTRALLVAGALTLAACGGGGGGGATSTPVTPSTPTPLDGAPVAQANPVTFANISVHDPSTITTGGVTYAFGSHLSVAKTTDMMNWTRVADGVNAANPIFNNVITALAPVFALSTVTDLWRPYVIQLPDGKFYMYYNSCQGASPLSGMGIAVASSVEGPYVDKGIFLKSGINGQTPAPASATYDVNTMPNVIDPHLFRDAANKLWMVYGSFSGGIFILEMNDTTGLPVAGQGYGTKLIGGGSARIEGSSIIYNPTTKYYYMFLTFGGLDAAGGYNIRAMRSLSPTGPYLDAKGNNMATVTGSISNDALIAPYGQKLMGNFQFTAAVGETGTQVGAVSPGGASVAQNTAGQYLMTMHSRFPGTGEVHEVRVHELFFNEDGWPVLSPFRYAPLSKASPAVSATVTAAEAAGTYKMVNHGKDVTATIKQSALVKLESNGNVTGTSSGTWVHKGNNIVSINLGTAGTFSGVLSRQWNTNASAFVVTFTAQSVDGVSIMGARLGN